MATIMQLWGTPYGRTSDDGKYLKDFDFEAFDGQGEIVMTPHAHEAKRFASMAEALEFYRRAPGCRPLRADGRPNRPLTATNWSFEPFAEAGDARVA